MEFTFSDAVITSLIAMTIVFSLLVILQYIIKIQSFIMNYSVKKVKVDQVEQVDIINKEEEKHGEMKDNLEIIAVITATLSAYLDKPESNLKIKSIKRINSNSLWQTSAIENNLKP